MTHQLDMMPGALVDPAVLDRIDAQMPKVREVEPRLPLGACMHPVDAIKAAHKDMGHEIAPEQETAMRAYYDDEVPAP